jgi:hypothetical protein
VFPGAGITEFKYRNTPSIDDSLAATAQAAALAAAILYCARLADFIPDFVKTGTEVSQGEAGYDIPRSSPGKDLQNSANVDWVHNRDHMTQVFNYIMREDSRGELMPIWRLCPTLNRDLFECPPLSVAKYMLNARNGSGISHHSVARFRDRRLVE